VHLVETIRRPGPGEVETTIAFVERVSSQLGARPLSDHLWLDLRAGGSDGFHLVRIHDEHGLVAVAQISAANESSSLEVVVEQELDAARRQQVHDDVATTAIDAFRRSGGGRLFWWLDDPDDQIIELAAQHGIEPVRTLYEMRRPLPHDRRSSVETRSFRPGVDDDDWLRVNNRAFAEHGEQGGWTHDTLVRRMAEPWFDPDGFRIHERDGHIAAFCWTKLHDELDPVVGEIYVIAVDPDHLGTGLGTQLTLAGLDSISDRGVSVANLYVDADNTAAVGLYDRLGFTIHRTRIAYAADLEAAGGRAHDTDTMTTETT
jgi:mycothiol synthase